jgi:hypothetical protein
VVSRVVRASRVVAAAERPAGFARLTRGPCQFSKSLPLRACLGWHSLEVPPGWRLTLDRYVGYYWNVPTKRSTHQQTPSTRLAARRCALLRGKLIPFGEKKIERPLIDSKSYWPRHRRWARSLQRFSRPCALRRAASSASSGTTLSKKPTPERTTLRASSAAVARVRSSGQDHPGPDPPRGQDSRPATQLRVQRHRAPATRAARARPQAHQRAPCGACRGSRRRAEGDSKELRGAAASRRADRAG